MNRELVGLVVLLSFSFNSACSVSNQLQSGAHFEPAMCTGSYKTTFRSWASRTLETKYHVILPECEIHVGDNAVVLRVRSRSESIEAIDERIVRLERRGENAWHIISAADLVWRIPDNQLLSEAPLEQVMVMRQRDRRQNVVYKDTGQLALYVKALGPVRKDSHNAYVISMLTLQATR